ncbi:hypothetical protein IV38_GL001380 [Lactobacillus selangorensis]|uniref:Uncharacterized protein n=1 Tax=Lactobacillus selangorensis TaxID=81857 RepID=A0A0R2FTA2_9LACO|nr:hypothetical protein [Lactobacillus selangorensis]KRN28380.1 hypothetical protein IV38_GL001380 [Lactobacillus selangorensis]KRN31881.1 hypothetical protein IV40_GL001167 [Lactobacillus selangorensis]
MRVLDLLMLFGDLPKNDIIQFENPLGGDNYNLADFETTETPEEELQLILRLKQGGHPLHLWELRLLIQKRIYYQHYVFVELDKHPYPIFGYRQDGQTILLG